MFLWAAVVLLGLTLSPVQANPKILCLHGGRETGNVMRSSVSMTQLQASLPGYDFVFADGGYDGGGGGRLWIRDPPGGKGEATVDPAWADLSLAALDEIEANQGPFWGILGYSQGSAMVPVYLAHAPPNTFQIAMMFCGYLTTTHTGILDSVNAASPFDIKALVWMGEQDPIIANTMTRAQAAKFTSPVVICSAAGGHMVPGSSDSSYTHVISFVTTGGGMPGLDGRCSGTDTGTKGDKGTWVQQADGSWLNTETGELYGDQAKETGAPKDMTGSKESAGSKDTESGSKEAGGTLQSSAATALAAAATALLAVLVVLAAS